MELFIYNSNNYNLRKMQTEVQYKSTIINGSKLKKLASTNYSYILTQINYQGLNWSYKDDKLIIQNKIFYTNCTWAEIGFGRNSM